MRIGIILGWFSVLSLVGYLVPAIFTANSSLYVLVFFPIPGIIAAIIGIILGIRFSKKHLKASLWALIPGMVTVIVFAIVLLIGGSVPFLCTDDKICTCLLYTSP